MKSIISTFYSEPVISLLTVNAVISALAAEGKISAWISVVVLAGTAPLLRRFVSPAKN
jgi:hypothetical protein